MKLINRRSLRLFGVVLWKNLLLKRRHYVVTFVEIVIPLILFIGLVSMDSERRNAENVESLKNDVWHLRPNDYSRPGVTDFWRDEVPNLCLRASHRVFYVIPVESHFVREFAKLLDSTLTSLCDALDIPPLGDRLGKKLSC